MFEGTFGTDSQIFVDSAYGLEHDPRSSDRFHSFHCLF